LRRRRHVLQPLIGVGRDVDKSWRSHRQLLRLLLSMGHTFIELGKHRSSIPNNNPNRPHLLPRRRHRFLAVPVSLVSLTAVLASSTLRATAPLGRPGTGCYASVHTPSLF
jgi:hypothetical protein